MERFTRFIAWSGRFIAWSGIACAIAAAVLIGVPLAWSWAFAPEKFVTNNRQDGPPSININSAPLVLGEDGTPRVHPDWLAQREFFDYRSVFIYQDNALGRNVCSIDLHAPVPSGIARDVETGDGGARAVVSYERPPPFRNRQGSVQPYTGYSLDRWTNFGLGDAIAEGRCAMPPGRYVVVTVYRVPVLGGLADVTLTFTSNIFAITED